MTKPGDMAVLLNANAKRVTESLKKTIQQVTPYAKLYCSKSMEEGRQNVRDALDSGCKRIVCGGGDGTLVHVLTQVRDYIDEKNAQFKNFNLSGEIRGLMDEGNAKLQAFGSEVKERFDKFEWPKIGVVKLGTGNGLAGFLGSRKPIPEIARLHRDEDVETMSLHLVESENRLFHFSGLGYDAAILNDYYTFKNKFGNGFLAPWFKSFGGYLTSMILKTIPEQMRIKDKPQVRVINMGDEAFAVNRTQGVRNVEAGTGDVLYEGPANIIGAATTPHYGYGLNAFPYALAKKGFFNFRIVTAGVPELVMHCPSIFVGRYESPTFIDFLAKDVKLEFDRPMPFQVGGDPHGYRQDVRYRATDYSVEVYNFRPDAA